MSIHLHLHGWLILLPLLLSGAPYSGFALASSQSSSGLPEHFSRHPGQDVGAMLSALTAALEGRVRLHGNVSCSSLRQLPRGDSTLTRELLGVTELTLLLSAGCKHEARALMRSLERELGHRDTRSLIKVLTHMLWNSPVLPDARESNVSHHNLNTDAPNIAVALDKSVSSAGTVSSTESIMHHDNLTVVHRSGQELAQQEPHLNALMFNIQQLARVGPEGKISAMTPGGSGSCGGGWLRMQGVWLLGHRVGKRGPLQQAQELCQRLGTRCAGVGMAGGDPKAELYQAVLMLGSRVVPAPTEPEAECWLQRCVAEVGVGGGVMFRVRRGISVAQRCINHQEQQVYAVVEWVPAVSTLYNLGTAVYYAARNCSETARERAILSAVDLGTDALMALTGGTVGVAGYALGAGVKTGVKAGVKYLLNNVNYDPSQDVLVNQESWENGTFTIQ